MKSGVIPTAEGKEKESPATNWQYCAEFLLSATAFLFFSTKAVYRVKGSLDQQEAVTDVKEVTVEKHPCEEIWLHHVSTENHLNVTTLRMITKASRKKQWECANNGFIFKSLSFCTAQRMSEVNSVT